MRVGERDGERETGRERGRTIVMRGREAKGLTANGEGERGADGGNHYSLGSLDGGNC